MANIYEGTCVTNLPLTSGDYTPGVPPAWKIIDAGGGTGPTYTADNPQGFVVKDIVFGTPGSVTVCVPTGVPGERCQLFVAQGNVPGYPGAYFWWNSGFYIVTSSSFDPLPQGPCPFCNS